MACWLYNAPGWLLTDSKLDKISLYGNYTVHRYCTTARGVDTGFTTRLSMQCTKNQGKTSHPHCKAWVVAWSTATSRRQVASDSASIMIPKKTGMSLTKAWHCFNGKALVYEPDTVTRVGSGRRELQLVGDTTCLWRGSGQPKQYWIGRDQNQVS